MASRSLSMTKRRRDVGVAVEQQDPYFSLAEAAAYTGTTVRLWRRLVDERRITFTKVGRYVRIRRSVIDDYLARNTVESSRH